MEGEGKGLRMKERESEDTEGRMGRRKESKPTRGGREEKREHEGRGEVEGEKREEARGKESSCLFRTRDKLILKCFPRPPAYELLTMPKTQLQAG